MINFYSELTYNRKHFWLNGDFLIHFLAHLVEAESGQIELIQSPIFYQSNHQT